MSRENVEVVRRFYEHFNQLHEPPWEAFEQDAVFDASGVVGFAELRGRDEVLAAIREYAAAWDDWRMDPEELVDAGDHVVTTVRDGGRLKATGDEIHNRFFHVFTFRTGKVARWQTFTDKDRALKAAGLSE